MPLHEISILILNFLNSLNFSTIIIIMHELSLCQALLDQVTALAQPHGAKTVTQITVRIGPLSGIVPELLEQSFLFARESTLAAEAILTLETSSIRIYCQDCAQESSATPQKLICPLCGSLNTQLVSGDELLLVNFEITQ